MKIDIKDLKKISIGPGEAIFLQTKGVKEDSLTHVFDFGNELGKQLGCKVFFVKDFKDIKVFKVPK